MPSAIACWPDQQLYFVALAGNNAIAVIRSCEGKPSVIGLIPTAWYPVAVEMDPTHLFVACVKGQGSREPLRVEATRVEIRMTIWVPFKKSPSPMSPGTNWRPGRPSR